MQRPRIRVRGGLGGKSRSSPRARERSEGSLSVEAASSSGSLDNLVAAHARCNNRKRDVLAAAEHAERWAVRNAERASDIAQAAADFTWDSDAGRSRSVAVATYSRLDEGAKVWIEGATLVGLEETRVERALSGWA